MKKTKKFAMIEAMNGEEKNLIEKIMEIWKKTVAAVFSLETEQKNIARDIVQKANKTKEEEIKRNLLSKLNK